MKSKVISLKFVLESNAPIGYLMVETDDENYAKQIAQQWGEKNLNTSFARVELHKGIMESPDFESEIFNGVRVWELAF